MLKWIVVNLTPGHVAWGLAAGPGGWVSAVTGAALMFDSPAQAREWANGADGPPAGAGYVWQIMLHPIYTMPERAV